jgi:hypothetical protein
VKTYSEITLDPAHTKVIKTSTSAFGNTVSMIELHSSLPSRSTPHSGGGIAGMGFGLGPFSSSSSSSSLIARLQFDKEEVTQWYRALKDCLAR